MSLRSKVEYVQEIKSSGNELFEIYGTKKDLLAKICPDKIPLIQQNEGNWGDVGCIFTVHYLIGGKIIVSKNSLVALDSEKMSMTYRVMEGDLTKLYKSFVFTFQITSDGGKTFLNSRMEYEKQNAEVPSPDKLIEFATEVARMVDAHILRGASCPVRA